MKREYKIALSQEYYSDVVYLSQYDTDYGIEFTVLDKYAKATGIDGYTAKFTGTRCDGLGFTFESTASGETVTFEINTSLTAISGTHKGEIVFYDTNDLYFGSANVQIVVEPAARPDGTIDADVERAQEIADQIQEIVDTAAATVNTSLGTLSNLTTTDKSSVVAAINEVDADVSALKEDLSDMNTATAEDVGKALKAKTVVNGKVTEWEFGEAGTPSAANWSANAVQLLVGLLQSAVYTSDKSADIEALADELAYTEPTISGTLIKDWQFTGENPLVDKIDGSLAYAGSLISMSSKGAILPAVTGGVNAFLSIPLSAYNIDYVGTKVVVNFGEVYLDSMTAGTPYKLMVPCDAENKVSTGQMIGLAYVYQSTKSGDFNGRSFFGIRTSGADYPFDNNIFGEDNPKLLEKSQTIFYFPDSKTLQITVNGDAVYSGSNKFTSAGIAFGANRNYVFPCAIKRIRIYKEEQA